jgi:2-polyprenyl-3-methyl-5-hydroxy-6-metoxy-1,4-benzoquinol methylase
LFHDLSHRRRQPEIMDQPGLAADKHRHALRGLARVNQISRTAAILWPPIRALARHNAPRPTRLLDVASGGGDVVRTLERYALRAGLPLEVTGCDVSLFAVEYAQSESAQTGSQAKFVLCDALSSELPGEFDVVTCSLFVHHLEETEAINLLGKMQRAAGQLLLVSDLLRTVLGYQLAWWGSRILSRSSVVHVDGPMSVEGAFSMEELRRLADRAGLTGARFERRWPQRCLLSWRRP